MAKRPEQMWDLMMRGSAELAHLLGLEAPPSPFAPARALAAIDGWVTADDEPLDSEEVAQLGLLLARVLWEQHGGGLVVIHEPKHPLDGEWALTDFDRGLGPDYHVPFLVSAARIGLDRSLTARDWYRQILDEGGIKSRR